SLPPTFNLSHDQTLRLKLFRERTTEHVQQSARCLFLFASLTGVAYKFPTCRRPRLEEISKHQSTASVELTGAHTNGLFDS
ncbi:MAG: hypothetical protein OXD00_02050, partial [Gammaproteobacteria bacterium]|nr:hypothetical protein [Gammaproteobacteria bacterium]